MSLVTYPPPDIASELSDADMRALARAYPLFARHQGPLSVFSWRTLQSVSGAHWNTYLPPTSLGVLRHLWRLRVAVLVVGCPLLQQEDFRTSLRTLGLTKNKLAFVPLPLEPGGAFARPPELIGVGMTEAGEPVFSAEDLSLKGARKPRPKHLRGVSDGPESRREYCAATGSARVTGFPRWVAKWVTTPRGIPVWVTGISTGAEMRQVVLNREGRLHLKLPGQELEPETDWEDLKVKKYPPRQKHPLASPAILAPETDWAALAAQKRTW